MKFLIFTKYRCSYCDRAKTLIEQKGFEYESINIEEDNNIEILIKNEKYLNQVKKLLEKKGQTQVIIKILDQDNKLVFNLKNRRLVDRKNLNLLKNQGISTNIF